MFSHRAETLSFTDCQDHQKRPSRRTDSKARDEILIVLSTEKCGFIKWGIVSVKRKSKWEGSREQKACFTLERGGVWWGKWEENKEKNCNKV